MERKKMTDSQAAKFYPTSGEEAAQFYMTEGIHYIVKNGTIRRITKKSKKKKRK